MNESKGKRAETFTELIDELEENKNNSSIKLLLLETEMYNYFLDSLKRCLDNIGINNLLDELKEVLGDTNNDNETYESMQKLYNSFYCIRLE